jgi:hypothetical protein
MALGWHDNYSGVLGVLIVVRTPYLGNLNFPSTLPYLTFLNFPSTLLNLNFPFIPLN